MLEALATIIILILMLVPIVNILVGAVTWGLFGAATGAILTTVILYMNHTVEKERKEGRRQVRQIEEEEARAKRLADIQYKKLLPDEAD